MVYHNVINSNLANCTNTNAHRAPDPLFIKVDHPLMKGV